MKFAFLQILPLFIFTNQPLSLFENFSVLIHPSGLYKTHRKAPLIDPPFSISKKRLAFSTHEAIDENFNNSCPSGLPSGWTTVNVIGSQSWECTNFGKPDDDLYGSSPFGIQINGFDEVEQVNEAWMISPAYDLTAFDFPLLSFFTRVAFSGPRLRLLISMDYDGGNPDEGTWYTLSDRFAKEDHWTYSGKINLAQYKSSRVNLAFVYYSSPEQGAARWTMDDFELINEEEAPGPYLSTTLGHTDYFHFGVVPVGHASSEVKSFDFSLTDGSHDLTVRASEGFELSKDSHHFSSSLSFSPEEAAKNNTLFARFVPPSTGAFGGTLAFAYGDVLEHQSFLTGSALPKDLTFDIVTWNIAWFGSSVPFQGPANINLQMENVKKIIENLDADVYALQEITDLSKFQELVSSLDAYEAVVSPVASQGPGNYNKAQKLAFLYKKGNVELIDTKVLLQGVPHENLEGYPSAPDRFWASGRLPFLMEIRTSVNGQNQNITLVNLHARSNGGGESIVNPRYAMRKYDVRVLKDSLDQYYGNEPLVILGDFNDDLDETVADQSAATVNTSETSYIHFLDGKGNYHPVTLSLSDAGLRTYLSFEEVIDHMMLSDELSESYIKQSERIVAPHDLARNYQHTTSDHLPVKIRLNLNKMPETDLILGLPDQAGSIKVHVYPNPSDKIVNVQLGNKVGPVNVELRSLMGKKLQEKVTIEGSTEFDVSGLPKGIYLITGLDHNRSPFVIKLKVD